MHSVFAQLIRFVFRTLLALLVIALILVVGKLAHKEWTEWRAYTADAATLTKADRAVQTAQQDAAIALGKRIGAYKTAPVAVLDARIASLRRAPQLQAAAGQAPLLRLPLGDGDKVAGHLVSTYRHRAEAELSRQELAYLEQLRAFVASGLDRRDAELSLAQLHQRHQQVYARYLANKTAIAALTPLEQKLIDYPLLRNDALERLARERSALLAANQQAFDAWQLQRQAIGRLDAVRTLPVFALDQQGVAAATAALHQAHVAVQEKLGANWFAVLSRPFIDVLGMATLILLSSFACHLLIKALFYYVLAPAAARLKAICLAPETSGAIASREPVSAASPSVAVPVRSAVSQSVQLAPDEQLLILPEYIQSLPATGTKATRWLLDWSYPWTSLISGMCALTDIRIPDGAPVVLSSSDDPLSEIALITLPAGAAMVFKPRGLVGVIFHTATPLRITRHWRLGSLHAWLTLQLRYLVFRGPVTLIVKGSRGVRVEPAGQGRIISQSSTLGFSANVRYSTIRCETFFPFYQGKTALLQDYFDGSSGYYVYDETPGAGKKSGLIERGFEGMADAVLKVFGI